MRSRAPDKAMRKAVLEKLQADERHWR